MNKKLNAKNISLGTIIFLFGSLMLVTSIWDWTIWYYPKQNVFEFYNTGKVYFTSEFYDYFLLHNFPTLSFPLQFRDLVNFVRLILAVTVMLSPFFARKRARGTSFFLFSLATVFSILNFKLFFTESIGIVELYGKARSSFLLNVFLEDFWQKYCFFFIFVIVAIISMILMIKSIKGSLGAKRAVIIISLISMIAVIPMTIFEMYPYSAFRTLTYSDHIEINYSYYISHIAYYFSYFTSILFLTLLYFNRVKVVNVKDMLIDMKNETNIIEELAKEKQEHEEAEPEQELTEPAEQVDSEE